MNAGELAASATRFGLRGHDTDPGASGRPTWACAAYGCPLVGALSTGGARYCWLHFGVGVRGSDRITSWLRQRPAVVDALGIPDGATREQLKTIGVKLRRAGLAEMAPIDVTLEHEGYGRHGEGLSVTRSELDYTKVYRYRLRAIVQQAIDADAKQEGRAA